MSSREAAVVSDYTADANLWVDSILQKLDTADLAGQLVMPACYASADEASLRRVVRYVSEGRVGGIVWLKGDTTSMRILSDSLGGIVSIPLFMGVDAEWGLAMRLKGTEEFPKNYRLGATDDDTIYGYGLRIGREANRLGFNVVFAPVLDVSIGRVSVMHARSYGTDPVVVADKGCSFARGLADGGVLPVAKHFPGLGATAVDSHKELPVVTSDRRTIESRDLLPFRRYIELDLGGVMIGHVAMTAIDSILRPATFSPLVIKELLREEMNFPGLIFSDGMNMRALGARGDGDSRYVKALLAGADILIAPFDTEEAIAEIRNGIASGTLPIEDVREKVRRILFCKYRFSK